MAGLSDSRGVLYIATGEKYVKEAKVSAESLLSHNEVDVTLYADKQYDYDVFDSIKIIESPRYDPGDSIPIFDQLPYDRTLFLDTDTYVCSNISQMFDSLDQFDIGATFNIGHDVNYTDLKKTENVNPHPVPGSFYELNTGVVLFKKTKEMEEFLQQWNRLYRHQKSFARNQPAFRQALYDSDLRILTLPREYNYRLPKLAEVHEEIKIIHGRHPCSFKEIESIINSDPQTRVITKTDWPLGVVTDSDISYLFRIRYNIGMNGLSSTIYKAYRKMKEKGLG